MTTRRLNKTVNALRALLLRSEVPHPDKVARLLLECTQTDTNDTPVLNISSKGTFSSVIDKTLSTTEFRTLLIKAGLVEQIAFNDFRQWTVKATPKLLDYRARYHAERQGFDNPTQALNAMETRIDKKLAKQSKENKALKAELISTQGLLAQNQGQLIANQMQLETHEEQLKALWEAIKHIEKHDAPVTSEKIERHLKAV